MAREIEFRHAHAFDIASYVKTILHSRNKYAFALIVKSGDANRQRP